MARRRSAAREILELVMRDETEEAQLVWDEYKYRHDLCWRLVFQITTGAVLISVAPYLNPALAESLGIWLLALPLLGTLLAIVGLKRLSAEHKLLDLVREKHRCLHKETYRTDYRSMKETFRRDTVTYLGLLVLLGVVNFLVVLFVWLPEFR
jgi:hypothetical protein